MARRSIPMIEISEVLYQWQQGRSKTKIGESLGISRPTVRNYLNQATAAGLTTDSSPGEVATIALSVTDRQFSVAETAWLADETGRNGA